jgi:hypothetical protein
MYNHAQVRWFGAGALKHNVVFTQEDWRQLPMKHATRQSGTYW